MSKFFKPRHIILEYNDLSMISCGYFFYSQNFQTEKATEVIIPGSR